MEDTRPKSLGPGTSIHNISVYVSFGRILLGFGGSIVNPWVFSLAIYGTYYEIYLLG